MVAAGQALLLAAVLRALMAVASAALSAVVATAAVAPMAARPEHAELVLVVVLLASFGWRAAVQAFEPTGLIVILEKGNRCRRCEIGQETFDFRQYDLCDKGEIMAAGVFETNPLKMGQLVAGSGKIIQIAAQLVGINQEKPRIETTRPTRRGNRAKDKTHVTA